MFSSYLKSSKTDNELFLHSLSFPIKHFLFLEAMAYLSISQDIQSYENYDYVDELKIKYKVE